jgi:hypothetical protein
VLEETTIPHTPQQNGKAERGNRTIEEKITCLLQDANGIDESERGRYWAEALNTTTYLINRLPTSTDDGKTPYEAYHGSNKLYNEGKFLMATRISSQRLRITTSQGADRR